MVHLFAPLGFTANLSLAPLRNHPEIEVVHLFYGAPAKAEGQLALKEAQTTAQTLGKKVVKHRVRNVFDYEQLLAVFGKALDGLRGASVLFNASGGTRVMTMAGTIFCVAHDIPMLYYDEYHTTEGRRIPLKAYKNLSNLGNTQAGVLQYLRLNGATDMGTIAASLHISPSTATTHVQSLADMGAVTVERKGRNRVVAVDAGVKQVRLESLT